MLEYRARWAGGRVGEGYTVFHMSGGELQNHQTLANEVRIWFSARAVALPNEITVTFDEEVRWMSNAGSLLGVFNVTPPSPVAGTCSADHSAASGRQVRWNTGDVVGGRRLLGRTFLVPSCGVYDASGNVLTGTITADKTAHSALISALSTNGTPLVVWSRRYSEIGDVLSGDTLSRPVSLRTRND